MILSKFNIPARLVMSTMLAILVLGSAGGAVHAQDKAAGESVIIKRAAQLRETPGDASRSLATLTVQTSLTRLGDRQGAWIKVRMADGTNGWVHMFDITSPAASTQGSAGTGALRSLSSFFDRSGGSTVSTATVGIRGLGAEDLANAQPNLAALAQADEARVDAVQARQFANVSALAFRQVEPLPSPVAAPSAGPARKNGADVYSN